MGTWIERADLPWAMELPDMEGGHSAEAEAIVTRVREALAAVDAGAVANVTEGRRVGHTWLRAPSLAPRAADGEAIVAAVDAVEAFARDVLSGAIQPPAGPYRAVIHLGIGGSALGPQLLVEVARGNGLPVHVLDTIDPDVFARLLDVLGEDLARVLVLVVSKSGATAETVGCLELLERAMRAKGLRPGDHLVAVTVAGTTLDQRAVDEGWVARFPLWSWVGGRFAATSAVGLLPLALSGGDMRALLAGAAAMDTWARERPETDAGVQLALSWYLQAQQGRRHMAVIPYADRLVTFGRMVQQLVMESLGKPIVDDASRREGLVVYGHKGSSDQHAILQHLQEGPDETVTWLLDALATPAEDALDGGRDAGDLQQALLLGTRRALRDAGRPVGVVVVERLDAFVVGGLIAWVERAVGAYAALVGVRAYDQPGVEAGKVAARLLVEARQRVLAGLGSTPQTLSSLAADLGLDRSEVRLLLRRLERTGRARRAEVDGDEAWVAA